jgi:hypothetical protein
MFIIFWLSSIAKIRRKICRKIRWFPVDFPADFNFKGLTKIFEHIITNLQQKKHKLTETKMILNHKLFMEKKSYKLKII